ncbi:hypothetical protein BDV59DRAFT_78796 [Aspergillus ambiguus]|uniref:uncharacterized protein n=1 Tax=Aspergillus ambiguus TaxID=176160 RepID=UPI003CCCD378
MPGMKIVGTAPALAEDLGHPLFRSHKSLPRRTSAGPSVRAIRVTPVDQTHHDLSNGAVLATAPALPLTPPGVAQEEHSSTNDIDKQKTASSHSVAGAMTPSKPSHPPTPETTPPRVTPVANRLAVSQFGQASVSSRAESFRTAREMVSDGETETPRRSTRSSSPAAKQPVSQKQRTECGNGVEAHDLNVPRVRTGSLHKRVRDTSEPQHSPSMEQFRETIGWPSNKRRDPEEDVRRFSSTSASSTIEAIIIDSPRPCKRTLRHIEKRSSLRSASSPVPKSQRTSLVSNPDSQHRLVHKAARITENDRRSISSEISNSGSSTLGVPSPHVDVIPVVVIPQRRSSLKSSAVTSREPSKAGSRRSSRRAPTVSRSRPGSLDLPRQRKRTVSDPSVFTSRRTESRGRSFGPPIIPPRSSSLSAPTSRHNSRTTSLTSESLRHHTLVMDLQMQDHKPELSADPTIRGSSGPAPGGVPDVPTTQSILIGVEDMVHLRPPSAPFTQLSIPSSSPGPIEINEAKTIAFFPHNNESLLLVNPCAQVGPRTAASRVEHQNSPGKPQTPETPAQYEIDSPLRNPRRPPTPPPCKVVPPTPPQDADRQLTETTNGHPVRRFGSLRRSWAARPRSDSFNSFVRSLSLTSAKNRKAGHDIDERLDPFWRPRRFWDDSSEPEDSPRDGDALRPAEPGQIISNSLGLPQHRVVFEGPKIAGRGSPDMRRRLDGSTSRYHASKGSLLGSRVFTPEALYSQTSLHSRRLRPFSWWRLRLRFGRVRSARKRLRWTFQQRAEGKREARREKLKQSIGEAVLVGSSTQARAITQ